jgi:hypothetical protein
VNSVFERKLNLRKTGPNQEGGTDEDQLSKLNLELNYPQWRTNMTSINEFFPGRYFKAETLAGKARVLRIAAVEREKLSDGSVKPVVKFEDEPMKLVLNRTNANAIATLYGININNWIGKLIELYPTRTPFGSNMVDAVRVRAPGGRPAPDRPPSDRPPLDLPPGDGIGGGLDDYDGPSSDEELVYDENE